MADNSESARQQKSREYIKTNSKMPLGTRMSLELIHGGFARCADHSGEMQISPEMMRNAKDIGDHFFYHLKNSPYKFNEKLNDHISKKPGGLAYSSGDQPSRHIPAAMTFVGQFIDHDLTLNAVNLTEDQSQGPIEDLASPFIDLDSVFGPRVDDTMPASGRRRETSYDETFGLFTLVPVCDSALDVQGYDVPRCQKTGIARIGDKRNDENQLVLQVHILMMRLNNAFRRKGLSPRDAKRETILHWQSFVATHYLPLVALSSEITLVRKRLSTDPDSLLHHPTMDMAKGGKRLGMPHEFAIGFRYGHSQLRSGYRLRDTGTPFPLFDTTPEGENDLRGDKPLTPERIIDWAFFAGAGTPSNLIDTKVNDVVFQLPPSTIPDEIKDRLNLVERNLTRSKNIGVCAGEDLVTAYNTQYAADATISALSPEEVTNGRDEEPFNDEDGKFRTPLWYYILREAEHDNPPGFSDEGKLGHLGSRLVAEVLLAGIYHAEPSFLRDKAWGAKIPVASGDQKSVSLTDIVSFVEGVEESA
ncbi:hypothetical protein E3C22_05215 [Jiella endophytica]|uniref:Peroxidase n=1 Tax=Jiella endophytica TaxID=2558362 RepID=A0A4Y8RMI3_9HYPH|nr:hypothetical protein [Jiella endophytica]TFF24798.1 hypothetical protein E3C22_05215 [Jiella endophytica]